MKLFLDTNVVLDLLGERVPFLFLRQSLLHWLINEN